MKLLTIELPTCNKRNFELYVLKNLEYFKYISKYIDFNINFQKEFTQDDMLRYDEIFREYDIPMYYKISEYVKASSIVKLREDTHNIHKSAPLIMSIDDDIEITDINYIKLVLMSIHYHLTHSQCGCVYFKSNLTQTRHEILKYSLSVSICTGGGIIAKNISEFEGLFPKEFYNIQGARQDMFLGYVRILHGYYNAYVISTYHKHIYDAHNSYGYFEHKWSKMKPEIENYYYATYQNIKDSYNKIKAPTVRYNNYTIDDLINEIDKMQEMKNV